MLLPDDCRYPTTAAVDAMNWEEANDERCNIPRLDPPLVRAPWRRTGPLPFQRPVLGAQNASQTLLDLKMSYSEAATQLRHHFRINDASHSGSAVCNRAPIELRLHFLLCTRDGGRFSFPIQSPVLQSHLSFVWHPKLGVDHNHNHTSDPHHTDAHSFVRSFVRSLHSAILVGYWRASLAWTTRNIQIYLHRRTYFTANNTLALYRD